ncbi:UDP-glycosyltransferase [Melia azedarach]|uniref:UDP-glycosyltransferase n=1 Tax=Melia azedarach TaxID=155640 RepID=A0ACC1XV05_MELAZ|nr:UDP-glycosyltransferase [Melia azedarach]
MEIESEWLNLLGELHGKSVAPIGMLPPSAFGSRDDSTEDNTTWQTISEWLGKRERASVVYVALGNELNLSKEEVSELALGLELSGLPFFWALRKRDDSPGLPAGFEERVKGRGLVWTGWVPQLRILHHESVGAFFTHCGYSSIVGAFYFGRPLIMLPFYIDQGLIARIYTEKKVGIEIPRSEQDGWYTSQSVAETIRLVMVEEEGRIYRKKAKEMKVVFADNDLQH